MSPPTAGSGLQTQPVHLLRLAAQLFAELGCDEADQVLRPFADGTPVQRGHAELGHREVYVLALLLRAR